jgi:hypothetical protein
LKIETDFLIIVAAVKERRKIMARTQIDKFERETKVLK